MGKLLSNYEELPVANKKVYDLVQHYTDGNISMFAEYIGVTQQVLERIFRIDKRNGKYPKVSDGIKSALKEKLNISESWFISENNPENEINNNTRPRIPYDAAAVALTDTINGITEYECEQVPIISVFPKYDFTIRITGKSMEPEYYAGDEVACLKINEKRFIQWGRVHVLDTTQGVVIKRIYDDGDSIRCNSFNTEYPDFSIPKEDIRSFNLVVGSVRL